MSARLADRQIRAAALRAVPTLDVRGPVSEALGRAGIVVPPADAAPPEQTASPEPADRPARSSKTLGGVAAPEPVVKPFRAAPWPTRAGGDDKRALSVLTADERRVHRILLDSLDRAYAMEGGAVGTLSYAEKKRLGVLDLAFINAQLAKMEGRSRVSAEALKGGGVGGALGLLGVVAGLALGGAETALVLTAAAVGLALLAVVVLSFTSATSPVPRSNPRRQIYEALRELALLVDDAPVSAALDEADRLIDAFAVPAPPAGTAAPPRRVRS